jgi:hypothetical protein
MDSVTFLMILVAIIGALYLYSRAWRNPEGFKDNLTAEATLQKTRDKIVVEEELNKPYATDPIRSVDDYEYSLVFKNEGDRAMTKAVRDALMSKYPMDWSTQPPSSQGFQSGLAAFKEAFANPSPIMTTGQQANPYRNIDGSKMIPPDTQADELKEREILQTYTPKDPQSLTTYNAADAKELIEKIYDAKGLIAEYKETGPNQFTIIGTRKKDEKIIYEDDPQVAPTGQGPIAAAGEGTIIVPAVAAEVQSGLDPFFTPSTKTRDGKWDYTSWTPGLERMFAPTEPQTNWY